MKKDPRIFLGHIMESIDAIENHTNGVTKEKFIRNLLIQDAVIRRIEIIGEAVKNLSSDFKKKHIAIEWRAIAGTRDKLVHEYFGVNLNAIWQTVKKDIPLLKNQILKLLENTEQKIFK